MGAREMAERERGEMRLSGGVRAILTESRLDFNFGAKRQASSTRILRFASLPLLVSYPL